MRLDANSARAEFNRIRPKYLKDLADGKNGLAPLRQEIVKALGPVKAEKLFGDFRLGKTGDEWQVHHINPLKFKGENVYSNFIPVKTLFHQKYTKDLHNFTRDFDPHGAGHINWIKSKAWK